MNQIDLGNAIRHFRTQKGYKQEYIAYLMDMTQANYSRIETGKVKPDYEKMERLAGLFDVTSEDITAKAKGVTIEHNNHPNSNNQSKNGVFEGDFEAERVVWKKLEESLNLVISNQGKLIEFLQNKSQNL